MPERLPLKFYQRDTTKIARELLGKTLVHIVNGTRISGRIVETEAYLGVTDLAAHSFGGRRTPRTSTMFMVGGHAYVYLIYGLHSCFNVVTQTLGVPEAVLIRALEPSEGIERMREFRPHAKKEHDLANGPGKLCQALNITRGQNALPLDQGDIFIEDAPIVKSAQIVRSPRIGVDYAQGAALWPLRFSLKSSLFVSKPWPRIV